MSHAFEIRPEEPDDAPAIRAVHLEAFPSAGEADLVEALRADGSAVFSLVAIIDDAVVGHVVFSCMVHPAGALGLAPVAVLSAYRRKGIAAALIREGLARAKAAGWRSVFVLGDEQYYKRFGFDPSIAAKFESRYAGPHLMGLSLQQDSYLGGGALEYAAAFAALG